MVNLTRRIAKDSDFRGYKNLFTTIQMQNSKLVRSLKILNAKELKRLLQFLKSPFYNANPSIVKLYLSLRTYYPDFDSPKLAKEKVFKKIFPDRNYNHQKMLNLMSDFNSLLEKYLTVLQLEKEELEQKKLLLRAYSERPDCYNAFEKQFQDVNKKLEALPYRDDIYFYEKQNLFLKFYSHPGTDMQNENYNTLFHATNNFKSYKELAELKLKCALTARSNIISTKRIKEQMAIDNPVINLYKKLYELQINEVAINLKGLSSYFISNIHLLRLTDRNNVLKILLNHCTRLANKGLSEFGETSFLLYKIGLENNCLIFNNKMGDITFSNIVTTSVYCKEFEWATKFIDKYQSVLDDKHRKDAVAMAMGNLYFHKGEYQLAIQVLQHEFNTLLDNIKSRSILIRAWYEIFLNDYSYYDLLQAQLDAFEKFIRRNKVVHSTMKQSTINFILYSKKIALHKLEGKSMKTLNTKIKNLNNLLLKGWLLEKSIK